MSFSSLWPQPKMQLEKVSFASFAVGDRLDFEAEDIFCPCVVKSRTASSMLIGYEGWDSDHDVWVTAKDAHRMQRSGSFVTKVSFFLPFFSFLYLSSVQP